MSSGAAPRSPRRVDDRALRELLLYFPKHRLGVYAAELETVAAVCQQLFARDYELELVRNEKGELCEHYPDEIIVLQRALGKHGTPTNVNDGKKLDPLMRGDVTFARCRRRFAVPVILIGQLNICRSATLSRSGEIFYRQTVPNLAMRIYNSRRDPQVEPPKEDAEEEGTDGVGESFYPTPNPAQTSPEEESLVNKCRTADIALLKSLGVKCISDLMIENRKLKFGVYVSSSEKADHRNRYADFELAVMPYPGVEWFNQVRAETLASVRFDWQHPEVNAAFKVPPQYLEAVSHHAIDWARYQDWDLITLTQHYLLLLTEHIRLHHNEPNQGLLIHCISGWDRTPLFISLLRLSLWADGVIHESLSAKEILYLTVGYDWLLFGHLLHSRLEKGEEIFLFCFDFLKHIIDGRFSVGFGDGLQMGSPGLDEDAALKTPVAGEDGDLGSGEEANGHPSSAGSTVNGGAGTLIDLDEICNNVADAVPAVPASSEPPTAACSAPVAIPQQSRPRASNSNGADDFNPSSVDSADSWQLINRQELQTSTDSPHSHSSNSSQQSAGTDGIKKATAPPPLQMDVDSADKVESGTPSPTAAHTTKRAQRLLAVRRAFVPLYKEIVPAYAGGGDTWIGWLGKLMIW